MGDLDMPLCGNCLMPKDEHADLGKCLYMPSSFEPLELNKVHQEDLVKIREVVRQHREHIQRQVEALQQAELSLQRAEQLILERRCTHKYPDGRSAVEGGFMFNECKICGYNDL